MILSRYLIKEMAGALFAVTLILLLVFLSDLLVRYLSYAASGKLAANILLQLMGFEIPYLLALLLPLGLYLGIILAYGRLYADNEMYVMHACGFSTGHLIKITLWFAAIIAFIVLILALWINPLIASKKDQVISQGMAQDNMIDLLMPGRFKVSSNGNRVVYVGSLSRNRRQANNIFIAEQGRKIDDEHGNAWVIVSAARGSQTFNKKTQERFIDAMDGFRYEGVPGQNDYKIIQFKKYSVEVPEIAVNNKRQEQAAISTVRLWKNYHDPENAAELQWRFSMPLAVLFLALLAIPLSRVPPRQTRYIYLFPAILIYIVYVNLLFVARNWIEQKSIPISIGMWWVHILLLVIFALIFISQTGWSFRTRKI